MYYCKFHNQNRGLTPRLGKRAVTGKNLSKIDAVGKQFERKIMSRVWPLILISFIVCFLIFCFLACQEDEEDDGDNYPNCTPGLEFLYDQCGLWVTFDYEEKATINQAWDSCQTAYGKMWRDFIHCWRRVDHEGSDPCGQFTECLPDHGFYKGEDQQGDDDDDNDTKT